MLTFTSPTVRNGKRYGDVYKTTLFGSAVTVLTDLELITNAYKNSNLFSAKRAHGAPVIQMLGETSLLVLDGAEHSEKRAILQPAFSLQLFPLYFENISRSSSQLWDHVPEQVRHRSPLAIAELIKQHCLRIIIRSTTGKQLSTDFAADPDVGPLSYKFKRFFDGFIGPSWTPRYVAARKSRDELPIILKSLFRKKLVSSADNIKKLRESSETMALVAKQNLKKGGIDILTVSIASSDLPIGKDRILDDRELDEVAFLMLLLWFAGYSTQSTTTMSALMEMHFHEDMRARLTNKQEMLISRAGNRELTYQQVTQQIPLLDSYIAEVMRLYPAVPMLARSLTADSKIHGYSVDGGSRIVLDILTSQRDSKYYEKPEPLRIDRFLRSRNPLQHEIIAFGPLGGAHFCLGAALPRLNMKANLSTLLRFYNMELDQFQNRKYAFLPDVRPASGVKVVSCRRKPT